MTRRLLAVAALFALLVSNAFAVGTFVPATGRVDVAYDAKRDVLYISQGDSILRYKVGGGGAFLGSLVLGGNLKGIDISPDGNTLAVADGQRVGETLFIHLVNLDTGVDNKIAFPRDFGEGGTFSVAYGNDGKILISSSYEGSGSVPLRRYDPATASVTIVNLGNFNNEITQDAMLTASGDLSVIGVAESNISDGRFARYRVADSNFLEMTGYTYGTSWFNYEIGANRDGTQYAIPTYGGTFFYDSNLLKTGTIGQYATSLPIGVAYHPVENLVYFPWYNTSEVRVYNTTTLSQDNSYNFETTFGWVGNLAYQRGRTKLSRDGSLLMVTVDGGVRIYRQYGPLAAADVAVSTPAGTPVSFQLAGAIGNAGALAYSIVTRPSNGVLSGAGANRTYTPNPGFYGIDNIRYRVAYGLATAEANVTVNVSFVNHPPVANPDSAGTKAGRAISIPVLANDSDSDGDPLTITAVGQPSMGQATIVGNQIVYSAGRRAKATDTFGYTISDGRGGTASSTVSVRIGRN